MPIKFKENQTVISCTGDILVLPFSPKQEVCQETAWLLLQEREEGEIGREPLPREIDDKICLNEQPGVLIGAKDYRSLDVLIKALQSLRDVLAESEIKGKKAKGEIPLSIEFYKGAGDKTFVAGFVLKTLETHDVKGRGLVRVCIWPEDIQPFPLVGKVIIMDGNLVEVTLVESFGAIKPGDKIGVVVKPFKKPVHDEL